MQKYIGNAQDKRGAAIVGASVYVTNLIGTIPVIYSDNGVTVATNPLVTDNSGEYYFYAANGRYSLDIRAAGFAPEVITDILLNDPVGSSGGTVTNVTGTSPIQVATGTSTPVISILAATTGAAGSMSAADKTKLDSVATGATANSSNAVLLDRANHTGTQAIATVTALQASLDAKQATLVSATNIKPIKPPPMFSSPS